MRIETVIRDTGHVQHGMTLGMNMNLLPFHGELCEIRIEALAYDLPLRMECSGQMAPAVQCIMDSARPGIPRTYEGHNLVFFDQQANCGASIGRNPHLEKFNGWLCRVDIDKVSVEKLKTDEVMDALGMMG